MLTAPNGAVRPGQSILLSDRATGLVTAKALVQSIGNTAGTVTRYFNLFFV